MLLTRVLPLAAFLGICACTSADILRLDPTPRPQTSPDSVQLLGKVLFDVGSMTRVGGDESERLQLTGKVIVYIDTTRSN